MRNIFDPDSLFSRIMSFLADLVVLNLVFLLTCLPVFTIGPAVTALYTLCFRLSGGREGTLKAYFRAFRDNFRQGVGLGLLATAWVAASAVNLLWAAQSGTLVLVLLGTVICLGVMVLSYAFPLLSRFDSTLGNTLKNALLLCLGHLPRSLLIGAVNMLPVLLVLTWPDVFFRMGALWLLAWFSASAYGNVLLLKPVFAPFLPENS